jgi:predicted ATPase/DNA-binding winged helix-turn-helix (wHTH) protein
VGWGIVVEAIAWSFGNFTLLADRRLLIAEGLPVRLGGRALDILIELVEYAGQFVSRDELITRIWGGRVVEEINLRVQVAALRRALGDDGRGDPQFILNVPSKGYCFVAPVTKASEERATPPPARAAAGLPMSQATLVGRESAVAELGEELRSCRAVTIVGPGGVGKSAVAIKVAAAAMSRHSQGVRHVELGGLADPAIASARIAEALGSSSAAAQSLEWRLAGSPHEHDVLLLLDGCEGVIDLVAMLAEDMLSKAPRAQLLATSREPLRIQGEQVHRLVPLAVPPPDAPSSLESALSFSSVQLFWDRACAASGNFQPSADDVSLMVKICRRLDGVPLAIELAAHRVEHLGMAGILEQLDDGFDMLADERRVDVPNQRSLRANFNWSFDSLRPDEQRVLCTLSTFAGGFSLASGVHLVSNDDADTGNSARELIGQLATKSLVSVEPGPSGVQYRLLGATREYARTRLLAQGDHPCIARRHAELTVGLLAAADADQLDKSTQAWLSQYAPCLDDVRSALDWLATRRNESGLQMRLLAGSVQLWFQLSAVTEYCERAKDAQVTLPGLAGDPDLLRVKAAHGHARLHVFGADAVSLAAFEQAIAMAESLGCRRDHLTALWGLWLHRCLTSRYADALGLADKYEALAAPGAAGTSIAIDRMFLVSLLHVGRLVEARVRGERALASILLMPSTCAGARPQLEHEAIARTNLARVLWIQGLPDGALAMARDAVDVARKSLHDLSICACLQGLCVVALWAGRRDEAKKAALALSELAVRHGLGFWSAWGRSHLDAIEFLEEGSIRPDWREPICGARQLELMATFSSDLLDPEIVLRADEGLSPWCEPEVVRARGCHLARMETEQGRQQALDLFERALQLARVQGALSWELRAATSIAALSNRPGDASMATELLTATLGRFTEGFATPDLRAAAEQLEKLRST